MHRRSLDPELVEAVRSLLVGFHRGAHNAVKAQAILAKLRERWPCVHLRRVGEAVAALRRAGVPIGSDSQRGYYACSTQAELEQTKRELRRRIAALARDLKAIENAGKARPPAPTQLRLV